MCRWGWGGVICMGWALIGRVMGRIGLIEKEKKGGMDD